MPQEQCRLWFSTQHLLAASCSAQSHRHTCTNRPIVKLNHNRYRPFSATAFWKNRLLQWVSRAQWKRGLRWVIRDEVEGMRKTGLWQERREVLNSRSAAEYYGKNGDEIPHGPTLAKWKCLPKMPLSEESSQSFMQLPGQQSWPQNRGLNTVHTQQ